MRMADSTAAAASATIASSEELTAEKTRITSSHWQTRIAGRPHFSASAGPDFVTAFESQYLIARRRTLNSLL
jgi:hypothetical protein